MNADSIPRMSPPKKPRERNKDKKHRPAEGRSSTGLLAVERATRLLTVLQDTTEPQTLHNLAAKMGCSASTVHRLVVTLLPVGLVEREPDTGRIRLGLGTLRLASARARQLQLPGVSRPYMERLRTRHQETVSLWVRRGPNALCIASLEGAQELRQYVHPGTLAPLTDFGAKSRVLLAGLPARDLDEILQTAPLDLLGVTLPTVRRQIERIRETGITRVAGADTDRDDPEMGIALASPHISAIAAPLFNEAGSIAAALAIAGPRTRFVRSVMDAAAVDLKEAAAAISRELGHVEQPALLSA